MPCSCPVWFARARGWDAFGRFGHSVMGRHNAAWGLNRGRTDHGKGHEDGLQRAGGVAPSLCVSVPRWSALPRLGAVERPEATLPHALH